MPFKCPKCATRSLQIKRSMDLLYDNRWDEITLQTIECSVCGFSALAVYKESRRGAIDSEIWEHRGYYVSDLDLKEIIQEMSRCSSPRNAKCGCSSHQYLGRRDARVLWDGLSHIDLLGSFDLT